MPESLEQAQEQILQLTQRVEELTQQMQTLSEDNTRVRADLESARTINQKLLLKIPNPVTDVKEEAEPEKIPTCEEFARSIADQI